MCDVVSPEKRSQMMAGIRGKDTKPEMIVRQALHARGFRFRLHPTHLPGKPDIVLAKYNTAIFINGCFWHGHGCHLFKWPKSNQVFWRDKITGNQRRDTKKRLQLEFAGWQVLTIWECSFKGQSEDIIDQRISSLAEDITTNTSRKGSYSCMDILEPTILMGVKAQP